MSDHIRRILQEQERFDQLLKPFNGSERFLADQASMYAKLGSRSGIIEALQLEEERRDLAMGISGARGLKQALRDIEPVGRIAEQSKNNLAAIDSYGQQESLVRLANELSAAKAVYETSFRLPFSTELSQLARQALLGSELARGVLGTNNALKLALEGIQAPWAHVGEELASTKALSEIIAMGRGIEIKGAFDKEFTEALRLNLGDWRADLLPPVGSMMHVVDRMEFYGDRGLSPELSDFPSFAFDESLRVADLLEGEDAEVAITRDDAARAKDAFERLRIFEIEIRRFIDKRMCEEFGEKWERRQIPSTMHDGWQQKREIAAKYDSNELPLIDYADFSDYKVIIEKKDNWNRVFKVVFGRAEDIRESFQRLYPVRIATMHARTITQDDELLLLVETKRVLKAIGAE